MRVTIAFDEELLARAKAEAARLRQTLSEYVADAVAARMHGDLDRQPPAVPVFTRGRLRPGVDATTNRGLLEAMGDDRG